MLLGIVVHLFSAIRSESGRGRRRNVRRSGGNQERTCFVTTARCASTPIPLLLPAHQTVSPSSQPLPTPEPLPFRLPSHLFPDAVMVLEYLRLFGPLFDIQGSNVGGVTYGEWAGSLSELGFLTK